MKVSFILPIYKKKVSQVLKCLKHLFEQSYKDIEVICVFDGPDKELQDAIYEKYKGNKFPIKRLVIEHGGAPKARNEGVKHVTGDVVSFFDSDSYAEPDMVDRWVTEFKAKPEIDFIYSGYKWTDEGMPGYDSEFFDPWLLTRYNYLCSMWPLKKEKVLEWDESLVGLQDWDYWRRVVDNGAKGCFVPGYYAFSTELPEKGSISYAGDREKTVERIQAIRKKFGDTDKDMLIHGAIHKREAIQLAKLLDADYFWNPFYKIHDYKLVMMVGFNPQELQDASYLFASSALGTKRIIYWMGLDAEMIAAGPYLEVKRTITAIKEAVHYNYCPDLKTQKILEEVGIEAEIVPLPREDGNPSKELPKDFKVLIFADQTYIQALDSVAKSIPDIKIDFVQPDKGYNITDYTLILEFTRNGRMEMRDKYVLMNGRYLISNYQEPYAGYVECGEDVNKFKNEVVAKIREIQGKTEINAEAQKYYLEQSEPCKFKEKVMDILGHKLEIVNG